MPRPKKTASAADMLKAARWFYNEKRPKKDIAAELKTDIRGVTKLLAEAEASGVVRIQIQETLEGNLEQRIKARFPHIQQVLIVPGKQITTLGQHEELYRQWAARAADYFEDLYEKHPREKPLHVGVTGGEHLLEFVNSVRDMNRENLYIHVTALIGHGRLPQTASHVDPVVNASVLWSHSGRFADRCEYATVSPYVTMKPGKDARAAVREELEKVAANQTVVEVVKGMDNIDVAFVGIGIVNPGRVSAALRNRIGMISLLEPIITAQQLTRDGAIGDLSYCLFDAEGNSKKTWRFWLTAGHFSRQDWGVAFYKRMVETGKKVVAFGGPYQLPAIKVALKAGLFNVWITDEHTARAIAEAI